MSPPTGIAITTTSAYSGSHRVCGWQEPSSASPPVCPSSGGIISFCLIQPWMEPTDPPAEPDSLLRSLSPSHALITGIIARRFGRIRAMLVAGIAFASGSILQAAAENIEMLMIGRVLLGAGVAFASVSVPLYNSEMVRLWTHGYADDCRASKMEVTAAATLLNQHCTSFNVRESTIDLLP